jgi:hypothetical protein
LNRSVTMNSNRIRVKVLYRPQVGKTANGKTVAAE